jgi:uncharacterized protein YdeI (YjbR/CyaY-like superfamily)
MKHDSYPHLEFKTPTEFEHFLKENHHKVPGIWMKIAKKGSGVITATYDESLEVALCYGWIDGQVNRLDETYYIQKWTPRTKRSSWSKRNTEIVARLIKEKRIQTAGLVQIETAKKDGRWNAAYGGAKDVVIPEDFLKKLKQDKKAYEFYLSLNKSNLFAIYYRLQTAKKPETRERRMNLILEMMKKKAKLY